MTEGSGQNLHEELLLLMRHPGQNEVECRRYLRYAKELLVRITPKEFIAEADEYRGHSGDSDYIIVCKVCDEAGIQSNQAYIWEVKAPQCYIFEEDTTNRVKPTRDFISAENQLLHYFEESKNSDQFREEFEITHPENVKLGGIIIGSKETLVRSRSYRPEIAFRLYKRALDLRRRYLYGESGIRIVIWDTILDHLLAKEPISRVIDKPESPEIRIKKFSAFVDIGKYFSIVSSFKTLGDPKCIPGDKVPDKD
jgi:hypothetical protein